MILRAIVLWLTVVGLAVLLAAQVAGQVLPSRGGTEGDPAYRLTEPAQNGSLVLEVASGETGPNVLRVVALDSTGRPLPGVQQVTVFPEMIGHEMGAVSTAIQTSAAPDGRGYRAETNAFEMFGTWSLTVTASGPDIERTTRFQVQIAPTRPQLVLFAGIPLGILTAALLTLLLMWRRVSAAPAQQVAEGTVTP